MAFITRDNFLTAMEPTLKKTFAKGFGLGWNKYLEKMARKDAKAAKVCAKLGAHDYHLRMWVSPSRPKKLYRDWVCTRCDHRYDDWFYRNKRSKHDSHY